MNGSRTRAQCDDEAMYANNAMGRLENEAPEEGHVLPVAEATKGFLQMRGPSV